MSYSTRDRVVCHKYIMYTSVVLEKLLENNRTLENGVFICRVFRRYVEWRDESRLWHCSVIATDFQLS